MKLLTHLPALLCAAGLSADSASAQEGSPTPPVPYAELVIAMPEFESYEVEYTSQSGRFFHQVRPYQRDGADKVSVLNIIHMPDGVIVDSRGMDRKTLRLEYMMSPYFAWGLEYAVAQFSERGFEWLRIPLGGGEATRLTGESEHGGFVDELGFSPVFAAVLPLPTGTRFTLPHAQPQQDGTVRSSLATYEVVGMERIELESGLSCQCWVLEQTSQGGSITRFWVSRDAPFIYRRHRDIGGQRDFVSDARSFSTDP